ncbi:MAG: hypothetical protein CMI31_02955 [Opitutae bacterium]|nr:hypothetical protein [Opitutae bacterium]|tara:strand:- start:1126 stop:1377 length:252 start_codon:yes stop_codon:yes gene_type:complete
MKHFIRHAAFLGAVIFPRAPRIIPRSLQIGEKMIGELLMSMVRQEIIHITRISKVNMRGQWRLSEKPTAKERQNSFSKTPSST